MTKLEIGLAALTVVTAALEFVTFAWAMKERQIHRDFKSKAEVWLRDAQHIAGACTRLEEDCKQDKVSVKEVCRGVSVLGSNARGLFTSIGDALNWKNRSRNDER